MSRICRIAALLCAAVLCLGSSVGLAEKPAEEASLHTQFVYGQSELGRDLICHRVGSADAVGSILMVFGVHGFEDAFERDGEVLAMIAERLMAHYEENVEELRSFCLYLIPSANPDGLQEGTSQEGFGRNNANGIDINRDFPVDWSLKTKSRNKTGRTPFSTAEARAIRDLVYEIKPDYAMDIHGWCELSFGNGKMAQFFAEPFDLEVKRLCADGMLCAWLNTVTRESMMIELPPDPNKDAYVIQTSEGLIEGVNAWVEHCEPYL